MTQAAYFNCHGEPLRLSAKDAVIAIHPDASVKDERMLAGGTWIVRRSARRYAAIIGTGATEEAAWREAWSRIVAEEVAKEAKP